MFNEAFYADETRTNSHGALTKLLADRPLLTNHLFGLGPAELEVTAAGPSGAFPVL